MDTRHDTIAFRFTSHIPSADVVESLLGCSPFVSSVTVLRYKGGRGTALLVVAPGIDVGEHNLLIFLGGLGVDMLVLGYRADGDVERLEKSVELEEGEVL